MNRTYSLRKKGFSYAYKNGKFTSSDLVSLIYSKNKDNKLGAGFAVSKKFGKAVSRNRLKRRLKACFFSFLPRLDNGYNFIIMPKENVAASDYRQLRSSFEIALKRAGLIKTD